MARLLFNLAAVLALVTAVAVFGLTDPAPLLPEPDAPDAADVEATRSLVRDLRRATDRPGADRELRVPAGALASAARLGNRVFPDLRAEARVTAAAVEARAAIPLRLPGLRPRWLNVAATIPPFEAGLAPSALTVGPLDLPPAPVLDLARRAANLILGDATGDTILHSAAAMRIEGETVVVMLALDKAGRGTIARGLFAAFGPSGLPAPDRIDASYVAIRSAIDAGSLPATGSFLPHLRFALDHAQAVAGDGSAAEAYTAAILGLARACSGVDVGPILGKLVQAQGRDTRRWRSGCDAVTLAGRIDSRRHFVVAAAIEAASRSGVAVSLGEIKELHDSLRGGSGFDFTDIAANAAGIRLSARMMAVPAGDWPTLIARLQDETAVMPALGGLPDRMSDADFAARFGTIDSPSYRRVLDEIEARIDALALHAPLP